MLVSSVVVSDGVLLATAWWGGGKQEVAMKANRALKYPIIKGYPAAKANVFHGINNYTICTVRMLS